MKFAEEHGFADRRGEQGPPMDRNDGGPQFGGGSSGCGSPEECKALCESNPEACRGFGPPTGDDGRFIGPSSEDGREFGQERAIERRGFDVPPGRIPCRSEEDCKKLFENNPDAFRKRGETRENGGQMPNQQSYREGGMRPMPPEFQRQYEEQSRGQYQKEFDAQYQEQHQRQYQEQYQRNSSESRPMQGAPGEPPREMTGEQQQMYQQYQQTGTAPAPSFAPPPEGTRDGSASFSPPPQESAPPPPESVPPPPPSAQNRPSGFVAAVFNVFGSLLR